MKKNILSEKIIILGYSEEAEKLIKELKNQLQDKSLIVGIVDNNTSKGSEVEGIPFLGKVIDLEKIVEENKVEGIIQAGHFEQSYNMIIFCRAYGLSYRALPMAVGVYAKNFKEESLGALTTMRLKSTPLSGFNLFIKNAIDFLSSLLLLIIFSPIILLVSIFLKIGDPRAKVMVSENRYSGALKGSFRMFRFRTLPKGESENINKYSYKELPEKLEEIRKDKRATSFGKFLRKSYVSELPQLFNVLRGEMSLVGPRPPYSREINYYSDSLRKRLLVKPGMTGLWQIHRHENFSFDEMFTQDSFYIENWSFGLDLSIIFKTLKKIFLFKRQL